MSLNKKQYKILVTSVVLFILMGLFPPWTYTLNASSVHREKPAGYALILAPPPPERDSEAFGVSLDIARLIVQWLVLCAAAGGAMVLVRDDKNK